MKIRIRHIVLLLLLAFVLTARFSVRAGEWYSLVIYPAVSSFLSFIVSWIPFSLEEIVVIGSVICLVCIVLYGVIMHSGFRRILFRSCEFLLWMFVWFYIGWGCNYYRESLYSRIGVSRQAFDEAAFKSFISDYADSLNASFERLPDYTLMVVIDDFEATVKEAFADMPESAGLSEPRSWQHPKHLLFNRLYSSVGVLGFVGPFFCETQLNADLLPSQLPFVYAHEYSHLLGVSSEDEANFWAYVVCTRSTIPELRFSGYYSLLPYVLANASRALDEADYKLFVSSLDPEIIAQYNSQREYWNTLYSKTLGKLQSAVYDSFLKGNKVSSGTASYLEVIDMIISVRLLRL